MDYPYDYLVVGAGLYGSVFAYEASKLGKKVLVIDKRDHIGGNLYCETIEGINVHKYGAHIFHTSNKNTWEYVNQFVEFNRYTNSPLANYNGKIFNLPFNMNTFYQLWGVKTPEEAKQKIEEERKPYLHLKPKNLEEQALFLAGKDIYEKLIKGYTEKQWGRPATEIPAFIIKRLPFRFTWDNNYFTDTYQGIPIGGYNKIFEKLLENVDVMTSIDYFEDKSILDDIAEKVIYTGKIDAFFNYKLGRLDYRSLYFDTKVLDTNNFQGNAVVNYTDKGVDYTRIIEHKHFEFGTQDKTVITKEYPHEFSLDDEPYYPLNNEENNSLFESYQYLAEALSFKYLFGGRLAEYKYYDMDDTIESALKLCKEELNGKVLHSKKLQIEI